LVTWLIQFSTLIYSSSSKDKAINSKVLESCLTKILDQKDLDI
jgi:hypothetical protein